MEKYHILYPIGGGAFGNVYRGRKKQSGQHVALKFINKKGKSDKDLASFRQEIQIMKSLRHENIVLLLDSFETPQEFCIVTEWALGELFELVEDDGTIPENEIRKIAQQLVRALYYLHSNRIIHRDLKPQNILISTNGVIKLCDFGFAKVLSESYVFLTSLKVEGTPLYMAPEIVQELPYNHTADLWALGVILFELFHGKPPFYTNNLYSLIHMIVKDPVKFPDNMSPDFKDLLKGLLNKTPSERLDWPELLNHPFLKETDQDKFERRQRQDNYHKWLAENIILDEEKNENLEIASYKASNENSISKLDVSMNNLLDYKESKPKKSPSPSRKTFRVHLFDYTEKSILNMRDNSPNKALYIDGTWQKYETQAQEAKGATNLRSDTSFLGKLLQLLQIQTTELLKNKEKKVTFQAGLRVLRLVMTQAKIEDVSKLDVIKNNKILSSMIAHIKYKNFIIENQASFK